MASLLSQKTLPSLLVHRLENCGLWIVAAMLARICCSETAPELPSKPRQRTGRAKTKSSSGERRFLAYDFPNARQGTHSTDPTHMNRLQLCIL